MRANIREEQTAFLETRRFASLDGLRCFSILAVIWHHVTGIGKGYLGVQVFFAISGFLITTLLLRERRNTEEISLTKFYARRSLRIFPLYYTVLAVYIVLVFLTQRHDAAGHAFFHNLRFFASYTSNWFVPIEGRVIFVFAWSLATEEQFYMVVPWIEKYLRVLAVPAIAVLLALHLASAWVPLGVVIAKISTPLCLGVLAAHGLDDKRTFGWFAAVTFPRCSAVLWLAAVLALAWINGPELLLSLCMVGLVGSTVIRPDHSLAWLLNWGPFQSAGKISYGMYMLHQLCVNLIKRTAHLPPVALFGVGTLVTYAAAFASYRWYESIFLRMKARYSTPHAVLPDRTLV